MFWIISANRVYFRATHLDAEILIKGLLKIFIEEWTSTMRTGVGFFHVYLRHLLDFYCNCTSSVSISWQTYSLEVHKKIGKHLGRTTKTIFHRQVFFFVSLTHPPSPCRVSRHLTTPCKHHSVAPREELPGFNSLIMRKQKTSHSDNRNTCQRMQLVKMLQQFNL